MLFGERVTDAGGVAAGSEGDEQAASVKADIAATMFNARPRLSIGD